MTDRYALPSGVLLGLIVLVATGLRIPGLFSDFWLDEIWTFQIALGMDSPWDVFTKIRHSNNHHLNTLVFFSLGQALNEAGDVGSWVPYRIHSLAAGVASVALAYRIGARHGRAEAAIAAILVTTSYPLIHFSSEARGYALVVFFGLASLLALTDFPRRNPWRQAALFWLCACLGLLSHLMYLHVFAAAGLWMAVELLRREAVGAALLELLRLFAVPLAFGLALYWFDVRLTKIGEGPELDAAEVFVRALSYALGGAPSGPLASLAALTTVLAFGGAITWWLRAGRQEWVFLATVVFVSPALAYWLLEPEVFFVRYFLLTIAFGLLALSAPLARALGERGAVRAVAVVLLGAFLLGNAINTSRLYADGRGDYLETVRLIGASAGQQLPTVGVDHRFRNRAVIRFYNRYLPEDRRLVVVPQADRPDWMLLHRIGALGDVPEALAGNEDRYVLTRVARYSDLSGWHWLVYRRSD
jgi:hypothetical protein